jgi:hypothetical protein
MIALSCTGRAVVAALTAALSVMAAPALAQLGTAPIRPAEPAKVSLKQAGAQFSNKTNVGWDPRHGTQVEYTSADGKAYLWYPTNAVVLAGEWSLDERELRLKFEGETDIRTIKQPRVCFRYGANTYNPVTGHRGDGWQCTPFVAWQRGTRETRPGDPFGLARRKDAPFVLPKPDRLTFAQIAAWVGGARR